MRLLRQIIREQIDYILKEGRFDSITGKIAYNVLQYVINSKKSKESIEYQDYYEEPLEINLQLKIKRQISKTKPRLSVDATAIGEDRIKIKILISVPNEVDEKMFYHSLNMELHDVIRHEIEHLTQELGVNYISGKPEVTTGIERADASKNFKYFLLRDEIPAMVVGLYKRAKREKKNLDDVFLNYIQRYVKKNNITDEQKNLILNTWVEYAKKHFPNASYSNF